MDSLNFRLRSDFRIGLGILENFHKEVSSLSIAKPLILCDENIVSSEYFIKLKPIFEKYSENGLMRILKLRGEPSYELF